MQKLLLALIAAAFATIAIPTPAADEKPAEKKEAAARPIPFRGKIASIDKQANTLKVGERTFQINSDTRIVKGGKTANLGDASAGEEVGGSYREGTDKKLNLVSLRIGARPETPRKQDVKE